MAIPFYSTNDLQNIKGNYGALLWELHQGAAYGDIDRVRECLEAGADINGRNPDFGVTALMLAAAGGYLKIGKLLLDLGADLGIVDRYGRTAQDWAICKHWDDFAELIRGRLPSSKKNASESQESLRMGGYDTNTHGSDQTLGNVSGLRVKCWRGEYREVLGAHLYFDCWRPASDGNKNLPFVILVHGGGWDGGDRNDPSLASIGNALLAKGFAVATIDYRLAWTWRFPDPLADLKAAVRYFRANADEYGIDPERIGVVGHSAGAHLALLLGLTSADPKLEEFSGDTSVSSSVRAVCGISCPLGFKGLINFGKAIRDAVNAETPYERDRILTSLKGEESPFHVLSMMNVFEFPLKYRNLSEKETALLWQRKFEWCRPVRLVRGLVHVGGKRSLLGKKSAILRADPMRYARNPQVDGPMPSFLLLHGAKHPFVPSEECYMFQSALREHKVDVDVRVDPNSADWHWDDVVLHFFERTLKIKPDEVSDEALWRRIVGIISGVLGIDEHQIGYYSSFYDDLEADSLEAVELVMAFEEEFGSPIPEGDAERLTTVGDVYQYLKEKGYGTTGEGVTAATSSLTPTASGEVIGKNSPKGKERKSESTSSGQSQFEYNDEDRFIVRLLERMLEVSNHNTVVEKALSFAKRFLEDELGDGDTSFLFSVSRGKPVDPVPSENDWTEYKFELTKDYVEIVHSYNIKLSPSLAFYTCSSTSGGESVVWKMNAGSHAFKPDDDCVDNEDQPAVYSEEEFKEVEDELEEYIICLINAGAVIKEMAW